MQKMGLGAVLGEVSENITFIVFTVKKELSPGTIITGIVYGHYRVIIVPGDDNGTIYITMKQPLQSAEVFTE